MIRPLRKISDFVLNQLPCELENPSMDLVEYVTKLLENFNFAQLPKSSELKDIALLDLKMIEAGIVHSGLTPPDLLVSHIDRLVTPEIEGLTYEDIVLINPLGDMRLFTRSEIGNSEKNFYVAHKLIEEYLQSAINKLILAINFLEVSAIDNAIQALHDIEYDLLPINEKVVGLREMPREHFSVFRKYLNSHPIRNTKGPSGAFTARIPILELLFRGSELPEEYFKYLEENIYYFPREGRDQIMKLILNKKSLISFDQNSNQAFQKQVTYIACFLDEFRAAHYGTVVHQIPEAIKGHLLGTAGENPGAFLKERIQMTQLKKERKK